MRNVKCEIAGHVQNSKHSNLTMQTTAEFTGNSATNIKLSNHPSFFLLTSNKFIM